MSVSRETAELLAGYAALIRKWNPAINLVAPATLAGLEYRHIADSAQLFDLALPDGGSWIDLGSGGGLPAVVIAILARDHPVRFVLVESDRRKSAFLATARRELGLSNIAIENKRIEALVPAQHRYASARALAPLAELLPQLSRLLASTGEAWLLKGRSWREEVAEARACWSFDLQTYQSVTDPESAVLKLRNIEHNA
ncbi:MAG: 16S rRNA (guanine(527)-N(7))-methyltransferase RsmG [Paracoccus sp. (in: a-proteobacteria)]|nr:16S rRNA (guanine(527)-N(7))-methyltransferase RsmG [Paracoccus sp. (in: a-proteobacteria)]